MTVSSAACKRVTALSLLLVGGTLAVNHAGADVIVNNLPATFVDNQGPVTSTQWLANVFTNTSAINLSTVSLGLYGPDATASLFADNAGLPGADLADLTATGNSADQNGHGIYDFAPTSTVSLAAGTNYWIVAKGLTGTSDTYWDFTNDTYANIGNGAVTQSSGASWNALPYDFKLEVQGVSSDVSSTPEPGTCALLGGLSLTGIGVLRRRRTRK